MNRREALARLMMITGGVMIGSEFFLTGCRRPDKHRVTAFTPQDLALMDEIADTIIPTTNTPGAKAAGVGAFMAQAVNDCYDDDNHLLFQNGLLHLDAAAKKQFGKPFMQLGPGERTRLLNALEHEQRAYTRAKKSNDPPHYFKLMKDLTLLGYFSSEIGCTKVLRYVETPGSYDGDVPYKHGTGAWVNPTRRS